MSLEFIKQINDFVIDSYMDASDEEILSLLDRPDYPTRAQVSGALEMIQRSIKSENRSRLEQKRAEFTAHKIKKQQSITSLLNKPIASMIADIATAMQKTDEVPEGLLIAFRNQENSSDEDIVKLWQDLADLGLIDSQDENS